MSGVQGAASALQRPFLRFGAAHLLRRGAWRRMAKTYHMLPTSFLTSALRYTEDGEPGSVELMAALSEACGGVEQDVVEGGAGLPKVVRFKAPRGRPKTAG